MLFMTSMYLSSSCCGWLYYDAGRLSMPAQQLVSSAIRIDFNPAGETQSARHIHARRPRIWQPFPNYAKVWTAPAEPLGLAPTGSCRALLPLPVRRSAPRPSLPPSSWQVTVQPFGSKEVHRFTGPHFTGMRLVLSMARKHGQTTNGP